MAEAGGFEPPWGKPRMVFETSPLNRSGTPPLDYPSFRDILIIPARQMINNNILKKMLWASCYIVLLAAAIFGLIGERPKEIGQKISWDGFKTVPPAGEVQAAAVALEVPPNYLGSVTVDVEKDMTLAYVNKTFSLPASYIPPNLKRITGFSTYGNQLLRADVLPYLDKLFTAAKGAGFNLAIPSAYRSYAYQIETFYFWVEQFDYQTALQGSARPGHSEHQLGTTVDISLESLKFETFSSSAAAPWVAKNAFKYGFVVSYPFGKEQITGYISEPWHIRWVGVDLATKLYKRGITLEEYFREKNTWQSS